jgi:hypothetical protein
MKLLYTRQIPALLIFVALTGSACGQNAKIKTITITNGDTTISEKEIGDNDIADIEKNITMVINEDGDNSNKKVVKKKIIVNDNKQEEGDALAYAYSFGDDKDQDVEITTNENKNETRIIIKKSGDEEGESKEKKTVIKKSTTPINDKKEKEKLNLNINIKNTVAKVDIETMDKEPINIAVLDENGKQVFYDTAKNGGKYSKEINLEKKGTYFLNIIHNKKSTTETINIK